MRVVGGMQVGVVMRTISIIVMLMMTTMSQEPVSLEAFEASCLHLPVMVVCRLSVKMKD